MPDHNQTFTITSKATKEDLHLACNYYDLTENGVILYDNNNEWIGYVPLHSLVAITKTNYGY